MGISSGHIKDPNILSIVTIIGLISIATSSYCILYGEKLYHIVKPLLRYIPGSRNKTYKKINEEDFDIVLFGYGKFGSNLYETLSKKYDKILVIDELPAIITHLKSRNIPCIYGDVGDIDFLEELNVKNSKMIISTTKNFDENIVLLRTMKTTNPHLIIILVSNHVQESIKLYEEGADYVILPHYIGAYHTSLMLEEYGFDIHKFLQNKKSQMHELRNRHKDMMIEALQAKMN
jgi:Trk K+ transport system NAD-binding subunit